MARPLLVSRPCQLETVSHRTWDAPSGPQCFGAVSQKLPSSTWRCNLPPRNARLRACTGKSCFSGNSMENRLALERMYNIAPPRDQNVSLPSQEQLRNSETTSPPVKFKYHKHWLVHAVQVGGPPKPPEAKEDRKDEFYANVGDVIRTLREDVPVCLKSEINYDIYRKDIVFRDPRNSFAGLENYKLIFWSLRFHGKLFFKELYVEVKRIWQKDDTTICLRWKVHGLPRLPWDQEGTFDGVSTYKLDCRGKIYEHRINNVIMSDPPKLRIPLPLVRLSLDPVQQPYPTPFIQSGCIHQVLPGVMDAHMLSEEAESCACTV